MHALPFLVALAIASVLSGPLLAQMRRSGAVRPNYRSRELPFPFGVLVLAAASIALIPLMLVAKLGDTHVFEPPITPIAIYCLGVIGLGLLDDALGGHRAGAGGPGADGPGDEARGPRGWRGHFGALRRGELSAGVLKALGALGLALFAGRYLGLSTGRWLLAVGVLVLCTNVFNLLDLRPGRAIKVLVVLGAALSAGSGQLRAMWSLGLFAGPALIAGAYDLRERAMLGDTGANLLGGLGGLWLVLTLSGTGQAVALGVLAAITLYGEVRSISGFVERTPGLRYLDSLGRPS
jgi:UDP-GlcNAc:undecaprenyl-phosphate/decaprenyl-phosphate GlcNAc-1-phosphate transferase